MLQQRKNPPFKAFFVGTALLVLLVTCGNLVSQTTLLSQFSEETYTIDTAEAALSFDDEETVSRIDETETVTTMTEAMLERMKMYKERYKYKPPTPYNKHADRDDLYGEMENCLEELNCSATSQELESWACIIYESMSAPSRTFHNVQHVFDVAKGGDCIQKLAAFFHDIIYYSVDGGLTKFQSDVLQDIITEKDGIVSITEKKLDRNMSMTLDIFGFKPGHVLDTFKGLNEFLSASTAVRCYERNMDAKIIAAIVACIEATIPFRKPDSKGRLPAEALFDRLVEANVEYNLGLSEKELIKMVQRAVDLGNRDLANFSEPGHAIFLSNTWNLLPESNISLRNNTAFRISDFAFALNKMTIFFEALDPSLIYMSFRDEEHNDIIHTKTEIAKDNIKVALKYMRCKGIAIAVVAAIAELTGGDAPLALFLGDLPERNHVSTSIEDHIHIHSKKEGVDLDESVFQLLLDGREAESNFDIKNSPLAAYLYALMGDDGIAKCGKYVAYPMDEGRAKKLLRAIPRSAAIDILNACAKIAVTRSTALSEIRSTFEET